MCPAAVVGVMPWRKRICLDAESEIGSAGYQAQGCLRATVVLKAGWDVVQGVVPSCVFSGVDCAVRYEIVRCAAQGSSMFLCVEIHLGVLLV